MTEASTSTVVHLPEDPAQIVKNGYRQAANSNEFSDFLSSLRLDRVPVFDSCDVIGRLGRAGETDAALAVALWLAEQRPGEPLFWISLGDSYCKQRQHIPGVQAYEEALRLDPSSFWGNRNLATELFEVGLYERASIYYEAAMAAAPSNASKLELRLRWLDCNVLTDRVTSSSKTEFGTTIESFMLVDQSGLAFNDGRAARLAVGGFASPGTDVSSLRCVFRVGGKSWDASPTFARNSIRRLASYSNVEAFGFVHYGGIGADNQVQFELSENDEIQLAGQVMVERVGDGGHANDPSMLEAARRASREYRAEASALMYGTCAQSGDEIEIVPFVESLIAVGLYDEAEYRLRESLNIHGADHPDRSHVLALACQELARSRLPGWRAEVNGLLGEKTRAGESATVLANLGHARAADGAIGDAIEFYREASRLASGHELIHFSRGIHTAKLAADVPRLLTQDRPHAGKDRPEFVHLFACDANYFRLFAPGLVASSARNRGDVRVLIHAHIINPDLESLELASRLEQEFALKVTTESSPETITPQVLRAYFTCARFLIAPQLLRTHDCAVLVTEADCLLNWKWSDLKTYVADADVGYMESSMWNWVPWTKIPAGIFLFTPSQQGLSQADYIARFIQYAFERGGSGTDDLWTVDQVALWLAQLAGDHNRAIHLPMYSILTLATGDKSNLALT